MASYSNAAGITCQTCTSQEFEEDDGTLTCVYCGTMSQDVIAESNNADDLGDIFAGARRVSRAGPKYRSTLQASLKSSVDPDVHDLLLCYQQALQLLMKAAIPLVGQSVKTVLMNRLKSLWMGYLSCWQACSTGCNIQKGFQKAGQHCACPPRQMGHPHFPSSALLLGFIYLSLRCERLDVVPADVVRWCERGQLPYSTLWEALPAQSREAINKKYRWIFMEPHQGKTRFVTPMNIWFHSCALAADLSVTMPPLNAPLVARGFMDSLGLPKTVWTVYCQIARIQTEGEPLQGLEAVEQMHAVKVMAAVLLAVMLCNQWQDWDLIREETTTVVANPISAQDLQDIPRNSLFSLLEQIRRNNRHYLTTDKQGHTVGDDTFAFNQTVLKVLSVEVDEARQELRIDHGRAEEGSSRPAACNRKPWAKPVSNEVKIAPEALLGQTMTQSGKKRSYERRLSRGLVDAAALKKGFVPYVSYARHADDSSGLYHMHYYALVERAAKHLYVEPLVLHACIEHLDGQILELAVDGKVSKPFTFEAFQKRRHKLLHEQRAKESEVELARDKDRRRAKAVRSFQRMKDSAQYTLPFVQNLGKHDLSEAFDADKYYGDQDDWWDTTTPSDIEADDDLDQLGMAMDDEAGEVAFMDDIVPDDALLAAMEEVHEEEGSGASDLEEFA